MFSIKKRSNFNKSLSIVEGYEDIISELDNFVNTETSFLSLIKYLYNNFLDIYEEGEDYYSSHISCLMIFKKYEQYFNNIKKELIVNILDKDIGFECYYLLFINSIFNLDIEIDNYLENFKDKYILDNINLIKEYNELNEYLEGNYEFNYLTYEYENEEQEKINYNPSLYKNQDTNNIKNTEKTNSEVENKVEDIKTYKEETKNETVNKKNEEKINENLNNNSVLFNNNISEEKENQENIKSRQNKKHDGDIIIKEIINKLRKNSNKENTELLKLIYDNNRNTIKTYSKIYDEFKNGKIKEDEMNEYGNLCDTNKNRRNKLLNIYNIIYNDKIYIILN